MQRFLSSSSFCGVNRKGAKKLCWTTKTVLNVVSFQVYGIVFFFVLETYNDVNFSVGLVGVYRHDDKNMLV